MTHNVSLPGTRAARNRMFVMCIACSFVLLAIVQASSAGDPPRMKRADAFLGIHFDFHAGADCNQVGARTTPEMVSKVIDKVHPDYIQIDCKGHPGYSSYPTKVGNPAPGFVGDPLRVWRDVTRRRGVSLFMHYSGVWDRHAVVAHPDWAARHADGQPDQNATSVFGPYVDQLMIPQLRELAGEYGVDGAWVDGDCWGATLDYGKKPVKAFLKATGAEAAPRSSQEPYWVQWKDFHREAYRRYLRHYVDALKMSHPDFQLISNWSFSDHMPEAVSAGVVALSGDFSPDNSVNSARFAGRCLEDQGLSWDLMSWSFSRKTRKQKPVIQLMQEAAVVLALGGGYQAYFKQDRDGAIRPAEMDTMGQVAEFCRARQPYCHRSVAVPQVALLYSTAGHYYSSPRLFHPSGSDGVDVLRAALTAMLGKQMSVQVLSEHQLVGNMARWPLIVVPGWGHLEGEFRDELAEYAATGGHLLLVGPGPEKLFNAQLMRPENTTIVAVKDVSESFVTALSRLFPKPMVEVLGDNHVDVSLRSLSDQLTVQLVNTSGPHANAPDGGIRDVTPVGPLEVRLRMAHAPASITLQPDNQSLAVHWRDGLASVTVPKLAIYSILVVEE